MALTYGDRTDLVKSSEFLKRVRFAIWVVARDITADANATAPRKVWAKRILTGSPNESATTIAAVQCAVDDTVGAAGMEATDAQIQTVVSAISNTLADNT